MKLLITKKALLSELAELDLALEKGWIDDWYYDYRSAALMRDLERYL